MTHGTVTELSVDARELGLRDLDFSKCAAALKKHIDARAEPEIWMIKLDVRWCVVIYSQAHIFLDSCFSLLESCTTQQRKLLILTTDDYMTRELTCYELFRTTKPVNQNDHNPKSVISAIDRYCSDNHLCIEVEVFSGDTENVSTPKLHSYAFPDGAPNEQGL